MSKDIDLEIRCSFCGKTQDEVNRLIEGPGVYICDSCINFCSSLLFDDENAYKEKKKSIEYFGKSINEGGFQNSQFSYDGVKENSRVILKGAVNEVMQLVNGYYKANPIEA